MSEWKKYKLGEIATRIGDGLHGTPQYDENGEYYFINGNNIANGKVVIKNDTRRVATEEYERYLKPLANNTILLSINGTIGNVGLYNGEKCMLGKSACYINLKDGVNRNFVYYCFVSKDFQEFLQGVATGTTIPNVPLKGLREYDIKLPNLAEQERIAGILSSLDDKIDLLTRQNRTLEAMAETLFRQYFIETTDTQSGKLGDYITETTGGDWGKENCEDEFSKAVQCIRGTDIADLNSGIATKTPIRFIKEVKFEKIEPRNGDLILEISGGTETQSTGRVTYINDDIKSLFDYPLVFSNFCRMLRMKDVRYSYFTYCYINYLYQQDEFFNLENGSSGIKNLDYKALLFDLEYPMPKNEQAIDGFDVLVKPVLKKINKNKQQVRSLIKLRDSLLPKLMNREIIING